MYKITSLLQKHGAPYAAIFGNHDDEDTMSREEQMAILKDLPYSLSKAGPVKLDGVGNYYVEVMGGEASEKPAMTIYLFDSHSYSPDKTKFPGYDWIKPSQIEWFKQTSATLGSDQGTKDHSHLSIAFIHIPLPEYANQNQPQVGDRRERVTAPKYNSGLHDALIEEGVVMVSAGHDHCNDYCTLSSETTAMKRANKPALWMCYGGGAGFGGYGGYHEYIRRVRMFEIDIKGGKIITWKRVEFGNTDSRVDEQILVSRGRPVPPDA